MKEETVLRKEKEAVYCYKLYLYRTEAVTVDMFSLDVMVRPLDDDTNSRELIFELC